MANPSIFRAYDIRGVYGKDFDLTDSEKIAKAFATLVKPKRVVVGCDNRASSGHIKQSLVKGLVESGCDVVDIGMVPTPEVYFATIILKADGGIMVTASHLGKEYNGLKMCRAMAVPLFDYEIQEMRKIAEDGSFEKVSGAHGSVSGKDVESEYIEDITSRISIGRKIRVAVDTGNGITGPLLKKMFEKLGIEAFYMFNEPDAEFPNHHPDPTIDDNIRELKDKVSQGGFDMGVAIDGDGDRVVFVSDAGKELRGDQALAVFASRVLDEKPGSKIMFDVKCSRLVEEHVSSLGGIPVMSRTGHSFVKKRMNEDNEIALSGELACHVFFREFYNLDDAFFASCKMADIISNSGKSLSHMVGELPKYFSTPDIRIKTTDEKKFRIVEYFSKEFNDMKANGVGGIKNITEIDGVRVEFEKGWGLLRASNTEPVLNFRFEANSAEEQKKIEKTFMDILEKSCKEI